MIPSGTIRLEPVKREENKQLPSIPVVLGQTYSSKAINIPPSITDEMRWHRGKHVISHAQDECCIGSWVFAKSPFSVSLAGLVFILIV